MKWKLHFCSWWTLNTFLHIQNGDSTFLSGYWSFFFFNAFLLSVQKQTKIDPPYCVLSTYLWVWRKGAGSQRRPMAGQWFMNWTMIKAYQLSQLHPPPKMLIKAIFFFLLWKQRCHGWRNLQKLSKAASTLAFIIQHLTHCPDYKYLITQQL